MRRRLVFTTAALIAISAFLPACSSSGSSKTSAPAGSTTSASSPTTTSPGSAKAALTCTSFAGTLTLTPPVSPTVSVAHTLTAKGTLSGCTGTLGITGGEFTFRAEESEELNCAQVIAYTKPGTASVSVKWDNGTSSTGAQFALTYASVTSTKISGKFTSGNVFVGKTSTSMTVNSPNGGGCVTQGVSLSTAAVTLAPGTNFTIS